MDENPVKQKQNSLKFIEGTGEDPCSTRSGPLETQFYDSKKMHNPLGLRFALAFSKTKLL